MSAAALLDTKCNWERELGEPPRPHDLADIEALRRHRLTQQAPSTPAASHRLHRGPTMHSTTAPSSTDAHRRTSWRPTRAGLSRTARHHPRQRGRGRRAGHARRGLLRPDDGRRAVPHPRPAGARRRRRHAAPVVRRQPRHGARRCLRGLDPRPGRGPERLARRGRRRTLRPGLLHGHRRPSPPAAPVGPRPSSSTASTSSAAPGGPPSRAAPTPTSSAAWSSPPARADHRRRAWCCNRPRRPRSSRRGTRSGCAPPPATTSISATASRSRPGGPSDGPTWPSPDRGLSPTRPRPSRWCRWRPRRCSWEPPARRSRSPSTPPSTSSAPSRRPD